MPAVAGNREPRAAGAGHSPGPAAPRPYRPERAGRYDQPVGDL